MKYDFLNKGVLIRKENILVIADLHIGYEEGLNRRGVFIPRTQFKQIIKDLKVIFEKTGRLKKIIILGDLKHDFGNILSQEWNEIGKIIDFLKENSEEIVFVRGNHDKIIEPILRKKEIKVKDYEIISENAFVHGHKKFEEVFSEKKKDSKIKRIFMGHIHPAVTIRDDAKRETYKCFLRGKYKNKELVVLPSFFPLTEGIDEFEEDNEMNYKNFDVFVPVPDETKVLEFGKLKKFIE